MYQRYFSGGWPERESQQGGVPRAQSDPSEQRQPTFQNVEEDTPSAEKQEKPGALSTLKGLFNGNIKLPDMNADTILLLVLVYFLVADENENISDTLLIIGVLLLLGF